MARKNRVTVPDGVYHITSRICNKAMYFKSAEVKSSIRKWIFDIAYFSGVEIYAWCIMDNHLHLLVHVPIVPERYWKDPAREPASWAFGMRPCECFPPLWTGDENGVEESAGGMCVSRAVQRPDVGFMLEDEEMLRRLSRLYSAEASRAIAMRWQELRSKNRSGEVDAEKERYCRRMYNVSQFAKTLKERIAMRYNAEFDHEGCFWQGRFYSAVVENCREVLSVVAGYIDYNPVKAKLVSSPEEWGFSSWSVASGDGPDSLRCRDMYCKMFDCEWREAEKIMRSVLHDPLPDGVSPEEVKASYDDYDEDVSGDVGEGVTSDGDEPGAGMPRFRASQAIRCGMWFFKKGCYVGRTLDFAYRSVSHLAIGFPRADFKSIKRCRAFLWPNPVTIVPGASEAA